MNRYFGAFTAMVSSVLGNVTKEDVLFYISLIISILTLIQTALKARAEKEEKRPNG